VVYRKNIDLQAADRALYFYLIRTIHFLYTDGKLGSRHRFFPHSSLLARRQKFYTDRGGGVVADRPTTGHLGVEIPGKMGKPKFPIFYRFITVPAF
jgi:hypothetical protein